jgi:hypothetical protein
MALIDEMTSVRFRLPGYRISDDVSHPDAMGELTLNAALKLLCPLWPIC